MYTDTNTVKLFDVNHNFVENIDEEIEKILISIHGEDYYDIDEEFMEGTKTVDIDEDTKEIKPIVETEVIEEKIKSKDEKAKKKEKVNNGISIKDFIPVLFFICIFAVLIYAGFYFLNNFDLSRLI